VALYVLADPGATTVRIDNIIACQAPGNPGALSLTSLVGKNIAGDTFYPIQSINGTTVILGAGLSTAAGSPGLRGYAGTTSTQSLYRREPLIIPTNGSSTTSSFGVITNSGTEGHPIKFSGGWNRTDMSTQTGETWISMNSVNNVGFRGTGTNFLTFDKFKFLRGFAGYWFTNSNNITIDGYTSLGNFGYGVLADGTSGHITINEPRCDLGPNYGLDLGSNCIVNNPILCGNRTAGIYFEHGSGNVVNNPIFVNQEETNIDFGKHSNNFVYNLVSRDTQTSIATSSGGRNYIVNPTITESIPIVSFDASYTNGQVAVHKINDDLNSNETYFDGAKMSSVADADRDVLEGLAWKVEITSAIRTLNYPLKIGGPGNPVGIKMACIANSPVSLKIRSKRTNTNLIVKLVVPGGQISGVDDDVEDISQGIINQYETLSVTFTPSEAGVVDAELQLYTTDGATTYAAWFDTATITQG